MVIKFKIIYKNIFIKNIEIESLQDFKAGMYINPKEVGGDFHIDVMIEKNIIGIDSEKAKERVPETIVFLIIVQNYPEVPPKVLTLFETLENLLYQII